MTDWAAVLNAVQVALGGDRLLGRELLSECWRDVELADALGAAKRCVIAHYLADLQDTLAGEIGWDERALAEFGGVGETDLAAIGIPSSAALAPSLHLNLGDAYLRQRRLDAARAQVEAGLDAQETLADDGYGAMIRGGLDRLAARLAELDTGDPPGR